MTTRATISSGNRAYKANYPERSADGILRLGNVAPDFAADTTQGRIESFHEWMQGHWALLYSHPADFTPVCTTELGDLGRKYEWFKSRKVKVLCLSVDSVESHVDWVEDIKKHSSLETFDIPIIGDPHRRVAIQYNMFDPTNVDSKGIPVTVRAMFIIDPNKRIRLFQYYPASVGRSVEEVCRTIEALQVADENSVATPGGWPNNHKEYGMEGAAFLLPSVSTEDADRHFHGFSKFDVPSGKEYLRLIPKDGLYEPGSTSRGNPETAKLGGYKAAASSSEM